MTFRTNSSKRDRGSRKKLLGVVLVMLSANASAVGWSVPTSIEGYYVWDAGMAHLKTANNLNPDGCQNAAYLTLDTTMANFKYIWSQILATHTAGQTGPYPRVRTIAIPNAW